MTEKEKLYRFVCGPRANILEKILMADVTFITDACQASESAVSIFCSFQDRQRLPN